MVLASRRAFLLLVLSLGVPSCGADADGSGGAKPAVGQRTFVGEVAGTDVRVAVVREGDALALFFCGGPQSYATSTQWIRTTIAGESFSVTGGAWTSSVELGEDVATGSVDRGDGVALPWRADLVAQDGLPGLYEALEADGRAGVIVDVDATGAPIVQGALVTATIAAQIVPIAPVARVGNTLRVTVELATGPKEITVTQAAAQ